MMEEVFWFVSVMCLCVMFWILGSLISPTAEIVGVIVALIIGLFFPIFVDITL